MRPTALLVLALLVGCGGSGGSDAGGRRGEAGAVDASNESGDAAAPVEVPDAFPAECGLGPLPLRLVPDAAAGTCAFTPADVACTDDGDCTHYVLPTCGCVVSTPGVSRTMNTASCAPPFECTPDGPGCTGPLSFETDDCKTAADLRQVDVACVMGQCKTFTVTTQ